MTEFDESLIRQVEIIKEAADSGKLVLFIGAGVSQNSGIPGWGQLTEDLSKDLTGISSKLYSAQVIAQMYANKFGETAYLNKVQNLLKVESKQPNPIHNLLFGLNPRHILTTNFDYLIERAAKDNQQPFSVVSKDTELPSAQNIQLIVKVHGDFRDGGNIVLKEDDYLSYSRNYPLIKSFIESQFASSVVVFIGYGYRDDNLKQIIDQVRLHLGNKSHQAYLIKSDESISPIEADYYSNKNIEVITYKKQMWEYLKSSNNPHQQDLREDRGALIGAGYSLFKVLNFILKFDPSIYYLSKKNIIDQALLSIKSVRKQLYFIPPFQLRNLFPFNRNQIKWSYVDSYNYDNYDYSIYSNNKDLQVLFKAAKRDKAGTLLGLKKEFLRKLVGRSIDSDSRMTDANNNFKELIGLLNRNLVHNFGIGNQHQATIYLQHKSDEEEIENDPHSLFFNFQFDRAYEKLYTDSSGLSLRQSLERGYIFYQFKDYKRACIEFQNVSKIAWSENLYVIYAIASLNIRKLLRNVDFNREPSEAIQKFISQASLKSGVGKIHETIYNLNLNPVDKELVRSILEGTMAESISNEVREVVYKMNTSGQINEFGERHDTVGYRLRALHLHINNNCIVYDHYTNYSNLIKDGLLAYCQYYSKTQRDLNFDIFYIHLSILYLTVDDILHVFLQSGLKKIRTSRDDQTHLFDRINSLLKSRYTKEHGKKRLHHYNEDKIYFGFKGRIEQMVNAAILIMCYLEISVENFKILIPRIVDLTGLIKTVDYKYYKKLLKNHSSKFEKNDLEQILDSVINDDLFSANFIHFLLATLDGHEKGYQIRSSSIVKKISDLRFIHDLDVAFALYSHSPETLKDHLKQIIVKRLRENFLIDNYRKAVILEVVDPKFKLQEYILGVLKSVRNQSNQTKLDWINYNTDSNHWHFRFIREQLIDKHQLTLEISKDISMLKNLSSHFCWIWDPCDFDYSLFSKEWLKIEESSWLIERLRKSELFKRKILTLIIEDSDEDLTMFFHKHFGKDLLATATK